MQARCRTLCTQALGRLGEPGLQQDCGGVAPGQPGRPSQQENCRGSISEARSSAWLGEGNCSGRASVQEGWARVGGWGGALGYEAGWVGSWVGGAPHLVARERRAAWEGHLELGSSHSPFFRERVATAPDQTPPPPSQGLAPSLTSLLPVPGHLFSRRYCQRNLCAEHPVSPPGTSQAQREPHCSSDRQAPPVSIPLYTHPRPAPFSPHFPT